MPEPNSIASTMGSWISGFVVWLITYFAAYTVRHTRDGLKDGRATSVELVVRLLSFAVGQERTRLLITPRHLRRTPEDLKQKGLRKSADANRIFEHIEQYETTTAVRLYVLSGHWTDELQDLVLLDRNGERRQTHKDMVRSFKDDNGESVL